MRKMKWLLAGAAALALSAGSASVGMAADPPGKGLTIYMQMGGHPGEGPVLARQTGAAEAAAALGVTNSTPNSPVGLRKR